MDNAKLMEVLYPSDNLMKEPAGLWLLDSLALNDIIKEFSSTSILHDQVQLFRRLDNFVKLDYMRVPD